MNRGGKRLALTVAATGVAVLLGLGVLHWGAVRDHVESWHFQLTRETVTIEPDPLSRESWVGLAGDVTVWDVSDCLHLLSTLSGLCVIVEPASVPSLPKKWTGAITVTSSEGWATLTEATTTAARNALLLNGWRVLEQRFPRRAYVAIPEDVVMHGDVPPWQGILLVPFSEEKKPIETRLERALTSPP